MFDEITYEDLRSNIKEYDIKNSAIAVIALYLQDEVGFKRKLILNSVIPEPLSMNFNNEEFETFVSASNLALKVLDKYDDVKKQFHDTITRIIFTVKYVRESFERNGERLYTNDFLKEPFTKQVQILCTYIESQAIYANKLISEKIGTQGFYTGLEHEIVIEGEEVSVSDALEGNLEVFDALIRFLHYNAKGKIEKQPVLVHEDISPYNVPSIQKIHLLTLHKLFLEDLWARYKYQNWDFVTYKADENTNAIYYTAPDIGNFKKERVAVFRYKYRDFVNMVKKVNYEEYHHKIKKLEEEPGFSVSNPASVFNLDNKIIKLAEQIIDAPLEVYWNQLNDDLGNLVNTVTIGHDNDITLQELFTGFRYLMSLADVYASTSYKKFDDTDYTYLTPIFDLDLIINHYSNLYGISHNKAGKIIDLFVFKPNPLLDIFSQPLIYVGDNRIVFTPQIVIQMNPTRIVNKHLSLWEIDISNKGKELEEEIKTLLSFAPGFEVNTSKVKFEAYDNKTVEYDLIATFDKKIVLIELKCLTPPFSAKEVKNKESEILYGVDQVNRRKDILIKEWEKVQEHMNITLPKTPPTSDDIIKIVCTNIFDFTGRIEKDVYITDVSSLIKYFLDPNVKEVKVELNSTSLIREQKIWEVEPTIKGFLSYLETPKNVEIMLRKLKEVPRKIMLLSEDDAKFAFEDYVLDENPYDYHALNNGNYSNSREIGRKIGRNEPCPCGGGKKYKKCHGKN